MRRFAPGRVDVIDVPVAAGRHRLVHHRDVDHEGLAWYDRALEGGLEVLRGADLLALRAVGTRNGGEVRRVRLAVLAKDAAERRSVVRHLEPGDGAKGVVVHDDPNHRNVGLERVVVALVGDGGFGQNPAFLATAVEADIPVVWVVMNNYAFGTIAGLEMAHYGTAFGCVFRKDGEPYSPDFAAVARAYGAQGEQIRAAEDFKPALERAVRSGKPFVIDVAMMNEPVPTGGHWNINDIYSPGREASHVAIEYVPGSRRGEER